MTASEHVHANQPVLTAGTPLEQAKAAAVFIHGRGASAHDILPLSSEVGAEGFAYFAPQAAGHQWYPFAFTQPIERNQPHLASALRRVGEVIAQINGAGIPTEKIIIGGFSQGACLALEYAARNGMRYGGVVGFSGGLIGAPGTTWDFPATLNGTPVFLGCSPTDPHISKARVEESAEALTQLGADVTMRFYPGMGHTINDDEIAFVKGMFERVVAGE